MKHILNDVKFRLPALDENVGLCVAMVSNFVGLYKPTVEELGDIRLSVSEAFTNCVEHAYKDLPENKTGYVYVSARYYDLREVSIEISDNGCGFEFETRRTPNVGFLCMNEYMDSVIIKSKPGKGTTILMRKALKK